ncbi:unnamed protein product, partial [Prorocentrum cordatum]
RTRSAPAGPQPRRPASLGPPARVGRRPRRPGSPPSRLDLPRRGGDRGGPAQVVHQPGAAGVRGGHRPPVVPAEVAPRAGVVRAGLTSGVQADGPVVRDEGVAEAASFCEEPCPVRDDGAKRAVLRSTSVYRAAALRVPNGHLPGACAPLLPERQPVAAHRATWGARGAAG